MKTALLKNSKFPNENAFIKKKTQFMIINAYERRQFLSYRFEKPFC